MKGGYIVWKATRGVSTGNWITKDEGLVAGKVPKGRGEQLLVRGEGVTESVLMSFLNREEGDAVNAM